MKKFFNLIIIVLIVILIISINNVEALSINELDVLNVINNRDVISKIETSNHVNNIVFQQNNNIIQASYYDDLSSETILDYKFENNILSYDLTGEPVKNINYLMLNDIILYAIVEELYPTYSLNESKIELLNYDINGISFVNEYTLGDDGIGNLVYNVSPSTANIDFNNINLEGFLLDKSGNEIPVEGSKKIEPVILIDSINKSKALEEFSKLYGYTNLLYEISGNFINVTYDEMDPLMPISFNLNNDIISYNTSNVETGMLHSTFGSLIIEGLVEELYPNKILDIDVHDYDYVSNGLSLTMSTHINNLPNGTTDSVTYASAMRINLNSIKLDDFLVDKPEVPNEPDPNVNDTTDAEAEKDGVLENPKTGSYIPYIALLLVFIGAITLYMYNNKRKKLFKIN